MADSIYIKRTNEKITEPEFQKLIEESEDLRIDNKGPTGTNPFTGEKVEFKAPGTNAAMLIDNEWRQVFRCYKGRITFNATRSFFENPNEPIRKMARAIAKKLNAKVVGEEGESYE